MAWVTCPYCPNATRRRPMALAEDPFPPRMAPHRMTPSSAVHGLIDEARPIDAAHGVALRSAFDAGRKILHDNDLQVIFSGLSGAIAPFSTWPAHVAPSPRPRGPTRAAWALMRVLHL